MAIKTKADLLALTGLGADDQASLSSLFDDVAAKNDEISTLRKKQGDADLVIARVPDLEKAVKERETLNAELKGKLELLSSKTPKSAESAESGFSPFGALSDLVDDLFSDEPEKAD